MDEDSVQAVAPPVVAVVVVHEPGEWFEETLEAFAEQDYPNLRWLFLVPDATTTIADEIQERVSARLAGAFVRRIEGSRSFGATVDEALRLVEGDNGFFLVCHDDIAPSPDAVRLLVEEIYRSNAGIVGPKLREWAEPGVLQSVGLGMDRFGEVDNRVEVGEIDQEQHDGVRDTFVVPSACMLIRADLFRTLGGFDPAISFHGDDVELCWRAHLSGARVVVVPSARVRHIGALQARRPDLNHRVLAARHRMRAVATLTAAGRLPGRLLQLTLLTFGELIVGPFTGTFSSAWASLRALVGLVPRVPALIARRRAVAPLRLVPEREVVGLQERGSARLNSFFRSRDTATYVGDAGTVRRWRPSTVTPILAWLVVIVGIVFGSRSFITDGVPTVGEFLRFPSSPQLLIDSYLSGWNPGGGGVTAANPSGWAALGLLSTVTLFRMGLLSVVFVIGLVVLGALGMWRLSHVFPSTRARIAALLVYATSPLVSGAMSIGSTTTLVVFAAVPWFIHTVRRTAGIETGAPSLEGDVADAVITLGMPEWVRRVAAATVPIALATAFAPVTLVVGVIVLATLVVGSLLAFAKVRTTLGLLTGGALALGGAALLNFPWITTWTWASIVGAPPVGEVRRGLWRTAVFEIGRTDVVGLVALLYLPLIAALLLARSWRLTWAVRGGTLVVVFLGLAVLADRGAMPFDMPTAGVLLTPAAVGLALAAASAVAAFDLDVLGGTFGWRQPLGLAANVAVVLALVPGALAATDGAWSTPSTTLVRQLETRLPADVPGGYNVLYVGDARLIPVPARAYRDGVAFAVRDGSELDVRDRWAVPDTEFDDVIRSALDEVSSGTTLRAGRLLAPLGIRYVVIPEIDGAVSTLDAPLPVADGLSDAISEQLDFVSQLGAATARIYENTSWLPLTSMLSGPTADASATAGAAAVIRSDLSSRTPVFGGPDHLQPVSGPIDAGTFHLAVVPDADWGLTVDGREIAPRTAFGVTTAYDVPESGIATLEYRTDSLRAGWIVLQTGLWLIVLLGAMRVSVSLSSPRRGGGADETLIFLDDGPGAAAGDAAPSSLVDPTLPIPRLPVDDEPVDDDHDEPVDDDSDERGAAAGGSSSPDDGVVLAGGDGEGREQ